MLNTVKKIIKNVLINSVENKLFLANVIYSDKIIEVHRLSPREYDWNELQNKNQRDKILQKHADENKDSLDGSFCLLIPGCIDPHVHFDTPGFEFRDDFEHGSRAAAAGGVTTVIDMPCTSIPPVTNLYNFQTKLDAVKNRSLIDFAFWGGVCRNDFEDNKYISGQVAELNEAGVAAYKTYLISGMETFKDLTIDQMKSAARFVGKTGKPMGVHAEDKFMVESRRTRFQNEGKNNWEHYCQVRDDLAEEAAIQNMIRIAKMTDVRIHIVHLSSSLGLKKIIEAQRLGLKLSAETCPQYLYFSQDYFEEEKIRNYLKTAPPVKFEGDKESLWEGLNLGYLNFITTDHAGCDPYKEKVSDNFWEVYGGIPGVEHRVPFVFSEGMMKGKLNIENSIKLLSTNAAEYFNLNTKGSLAHGYDADFTLINLWDSQIIENARMHSKGKYTPFNNVTFNAVVEKTILRGKVIFEKNGKTETDIGYGEFIPVN